MADKKQFTGLLRQDHPYADAVLRSWSSWVAANGCLACGCELDPSYKDSLCLTCAQTLWSMPRCKRCDERCHPMEHASSRCFKCRRKKMAHDKALSLGPYQLWLRQAILRVKYSQDSVALDHLQGMALNFPVPHGADVVLTYVPSHPKRCRQRGASGQHLPQMLKGYLTMNGLTLHTCLKKTQFIEAQVNRNRSQRLNGEDLFFEVVASSLEGKEVWLFDDVTTTGATFRAAVRALKSAGAKGVSTLAFAKSTLETSHATAISAS